MKYITLLSIFAVLFFSGCGSKEEFNIIKKESLLSFPIMVSKTDAKENQQEYEEQVIQRIAKNSLFSLEKPVDGIVLNFFLLSATQRYGATQLTAVWSDEHNTSRLFRAVYPLESIRIEGGRSMMVKLYPAVNVSPKLPSLAGFTSEQSSMIHKDAKWLHDGLTSVSKIIGTTKQ